jgi:tRNA(Arg) A34 adenosine deaminase TadA
MEDGVIVDNMDFTEIDERLVRQAIELARSARQAGNHPFGALLALNGAALRFHGAASDGGRRGGLSRITQSL